VAHLSYHRTEPLSKETPSRIFQPIDELDVSLLGPIEPRLLPFLAVFLVEAASECSAGMLPTRVFHKL